MNKIEVGTCVRVGSGRNTGQQGIVHKVSEDSVYVDFGRSITVNEGFGSMGQYPDGYWVLARNVAVV